MRIRAVNPGRATLADTNRWRWQDTGACRGEDLNLFYGPPHERPEPRARREAKALSVCARCPLATQQACLEAALVPGPTGQHGVQGGMTAEERITERRNRARRVARAVA